MGRNRRSGGHIRSSEGLDKGEVESMKREDKVKIWYYGDRMEISIGAKDNRTFQTLLEAVKSFPERRWNPSTYRWVVVTDTPTKEGFMTPLGELLNAGVPVEVVDDRGFELSVEELYRKLKDDLTVLGGVISTHYICKEHPTNPYAIIIKLRKYDEELAYDLRDRVRELGGSFDYATKTNTVLLKSPEMADMVGSYFGCTSITDKIAERLRWNAEAQKKMEDDPPSDDIPFTPYSWQNTGMDFILKNKYVLIGDEVGLGKTAEAMGALRIAGVKRIVVVIPAHLRAGWKRGVLKFFDENASVNIVKGTKPSTLDKGDIQIISYNLLGYWLNELVEYQPEAIIFDEVHYIKAWAKSGQSQRATNSAELVNLTKPDYIIALSGSFVVNNAIDVWNILEKVRHPAWVDEDVRGGYSYFSRNFVVEERNHMGYLKRVGSKNLPRLHDELISTVLLRRTQEDVGLLFSQLNLPEFLDLTQDEIEQSWEGDSAFKLWSAVAEAKKRSTVTWVKDWLNNNPTKKLVVWGQHNNLLQAIHDEIGDISILVIGSANEDAAVQEFKNDPTKRLILIGFQKGSEGLNGLQEAANNMAFVELPMTYTTIEQAKGRIRRIGQEQSGIFYYYLIAGGTYEVELLEMLKKKEEMAEAIRTGIVAPGTMSDIHEDLSHYVMEMKKRHDAERGLRQNPRRRAPFTKEKLYSAGNISVVVGRRGSGKTALGFRILDEAHEAGKLTYVVGAPQSTMALLPSWVMNIKEISMAPDNAVVLADEAVLTYSNREWTRDKSAKLNSAIDLARQKDLALIFITLNSAMIDVNIVRTIDTLILKEPSLLQEETERPFMRKFLKKADDMFDGIPETDDPRSWCAIFDTNEETMLKMELPSFWSDSLSKSWASYNEQAQTEPDGTMPKDVKPICTSCRHWVVDEAHDEAWCILGHDVPRMQCEDYEEVGGKRKVVKFGDKKKKR